MTTATPCPSCGGSRRSPGLAVNAGPGGANVIVGFHDATLKVAKRMEPSVAKAFLSAVEKYQKQIDEAAIRSALASGDAATLAAVMDASKLGSIMTNEGAMEAAMANTFTAGGDASSKVLEQAFGVRPSSFKATDPKAVLFAREQAGTLIVQISDEVMEAVRIVLAAAQEYGLTTVQQARAIREIVGLPPNWANAPLNFAEEIRAGQAAAATRRRLSAVDKARIRARIKAGTVDEAFIEEMQRKYTASLLNRRGLNIARTETMKAAINGQHEAWRSAVREGILPSTTRRAVIVTPDDRLRPTHAQVPSMNLDGVGIDEAFDTPWGSMMNPPWQPLCRCGVGLFFPGLLPGAREA